MNAKVATGIRTRPATHRTLFAIARAEITTHPTLTDCEWLVRIRARLWLQDYDSPPTEALLAAMRAVQHVTGIDVPARRAPDRPSDAAMVDLAREGFRRVVESRTHRATVRRDVPGSAPMSLRELLVELKKREDR